MREFIVKNFALDYIYKVFGITYSYTRGVVFIYPMFVLCGLFIALDDDWPVIDMLDATLLFFLAVSVFFGFFHFRMSPVKLEELKDWEQVYVYEQAIIQKVVDVPIDEETMKAFFEANKKYKELIEDKKFYKPWRIIFHPIISFLVTVGITLFYLSFF